MKVKPGGLTASVPVSEDVGLDLDHMGLIYYPHDRLHCNGCAVNRELYRESREAIETLHEKVDRAFLNNDEIA